MQLAGDMLIGGVAVRHSSPEIRAVDPSNGSKLDPSFAGGTIADVDQACGLAWAAFDIFEKLVWTCVRDCSKVLPSKFSRSETS